MATRSLVGILNSKTNFVDYLYIHFDGYLEGGVGETLNTHFSTQDAAEKLFENSQKHHLREITPELLNPISEENEKEFFLEEGGMCSVELKDYINEAKEMWAEFAYVFIPGAGWFFSTGNNTEFFPLAEVLAASKKSQ